MKLHLGCFSQPVDGWYNTDITPHIFVSRIPFAARVLSALGKMPAHRLEEHQRGAFRKVHYLNVAKALPFPSGSVEAVFSSHLIEHLHPTVADRLMRESLRVLRPGGVLRVVAPSLEWAMARYSEKDPAEFLATVFEHGQAGVKNRHQWMYTASSLVSLLQKVGFTEAAPMKYREGRLPDIEKLDNRPENSIYVEGIKG